MIRYPKVVRCADAVPAGIFHLFCPGTRFVKTVARHVDEIFHLKLLICPVGIVKA